MGKKTQTKSTNAEMTARVQAVSERTADIYMQRARKLIQQDSEIERPEWLAAAIARLVKYEQKAGKEDNLQVAIKALETQAKLLRFDI
jgi:hypothetical protein